MYDGFFAMDSVGVFVRRLRDESGFTVVFESVDCKSSVATTGD